MVPIPGDGLAAEFRFPELEALACIPRPLADPTWEQTLREALAARAAPYAREAGAFVRQSLPGSHVGVLCQRGDWHGDRCVLEFVPHGVFIKPKPAGAEEIFYEIFSRLIREKLGRELDAPFHRVGAFIVQEKIESTPDLADSRAFGLILGLIFMAAVTDLNAENLRVRHGIPVPIDVECALDFSFYDADLATISRRLREQTQAFLLTLAYAPGPGKFCRRDYLAGFVEGAAFVREALAAAALRVPGAADGWSLRRVLLPTRVYLDFLRRKTIFRWEGSTVRREWEQLRQQSASARVVRAEADALSTGNVPLFHQQGGALRDGMDGTLLEDGWRPPPGQHAAAHFDRWSDEELELLRAAMR